jgi:hypothetical protein
MALPVCRDDLSAGRLRSRAALCASGSVLLEVVLALALFVGAATIISAGINASFGSVDRLRLQSHALNLAVTVISEMQMQMRPIAPTGPEPFAPPFQEWTYKIEVAQSEGAIYSSESLRPVEVIIRHDHENVVQRLTQLFAATQLSTDETNSPAQLLNPVLP